MSYIGNSPGVASQRVTTTLTATAAQTQFTTQSGYVLGYVDVYLNGAKLVNGADFEAITGTYITLFAGAAAGDIVELISYVPRGLSDGYTKAEADSKFLDVGGDTATGNLAFATATLSGNLTLNGGTANGVGYLNGSKVVTTGSALTFDGSILATPTLNLTNALGIAYGGTGATTAAGALTSLGAYAASNPSGYTTNLGTVTSVGASVPSFLSVTGSPITTSGTLAISLSGTALPTTSGGTGLTAFTSGGVVYASSTSALATGSLFTYNGTSAQIGDSLSGADGSRLYIYGNAPASTQIGIKIGGNANLLPQQAIRFYDTWFEAYAGYIGFTTNSLTFGAGNTEGLRLTSSSFYTASGISVGIGLSNPTAQLEIGRTSTSGYSTLRLSNSGANGRTYEIGLGGNTAAAGYANNLYFYDSTAGVNRMVLDSLGNVGVNGTPSSWASVYKALQLNTYGAITSDTSKKVNISSNAYAYAQDLWAYLANDNATLYQQTAGKHIWSNAPSGIGAGQAVNFTPLMTLGSDGNMILGGTSPTTSGGYTSLSINNATNSGYVVLQSNGTNKSDWYVSGGTIASLRGVGVPLILASTGANYISLQTNSTEQGRFTSTGLNVTGAITENNVAVVTQSDIGTAPNEIPLNQYLGNMAYQDSANYYNTGMTAGFRNRIINGAMAIAQRGYAATGNPGLGYSSIGTLDRWGFWCAGNNTFTTAQVSDAPTGFVYSTLITTVNPITFGASTYGTFSQRIEGYNIVDLAWGTANAKPITISFWIKSSLTGTFSAYVFNDGYTYCYPYTFNIPTANTWVQITKTIAGPTVGTWQTDTRVGIEFGITLMNGTNYSAPADAWISGNYRIGSPNSVNLLSTSGATMNVTGVQIESGSVATPFDVRPYGTELALCQRYCYVLYNTDSEGATIGVSSVYNTTTVFSYVYLPVPMRTNPSLTTVAAGGGNWFNNYFGASGQSVNTSPTLSSSSNSLNTTNVRMFVGGFTGLTVGQAGWAQVIQNAKAIFSAEL